MANYKYKIYNKRGKLVAEATTKREAEKEAKKLGGYYMDQSGLYQLKNPHCPTEQHSNPQMTTAMFADMFDLDMQQDNDGQTIFYASSQPGPKLKELVRQARNAGYSMEQNNDGSITIYTDEYSNPHCPTEQHSNPHCYKNPADDPEFQQGFSAGLAAIASASSYYGKRANPEPEAPSQASPAYQAGFVAAVQMFGVHLISQSDISRAVVEELAGASIAPPPRVTRRPRKKKQTLATTSDTSKLATLVLNVIPPEANSPATKVKRGMIIAAVSGVDKKAGESLKKGAVWSATIKELMSAGLVAQDGTKRGAGYYLTGQQAVVIEEPAPKKKKKAKKKVEKTKASVELNTTALLEAKAAALAAGVQQSEVDALEQQVKNLIAQDKHAVATLMDMMGKMSIFAAAKDPSKSTQQMEDLLKKMNSQNRVFDLTIVSNPYYGEGKSKVWGAWG